jgi:hypothetical protein
VVLKYEIKQMYSFIHFWKEFNKSHNYVCFYAGLWKQGKFVEVQKYSLPIVVGSDFCDSKTKTFYYLIAK